MSDILESQREDAPRVPKSARRFGTFPGKRYAPAEENI